MGPTPCEVGAASSVAGEPGSRSRYFRSGDGHPSPSPDRKWMTYGIERAHPLRCTLVYPQLERCR